VREHARQRGVQLVANRVVLGVEVEQRKSHTPGRGPARR
jgi:hypothetical protein